ncbi:glycosyltransferase family 39 protein [Archangium lansingense]|uniref:Glycosyltransferase family 39 protein n=1 Tax=Archangium lansingense TaxID=2995310 RepID=A0ABT4AHU7_9BACT|nr:glycosyltransferase family 39 protein [Archangium lansinium]MCY1081205.1 glycosyltransferase family 39 protein [Archangium lansinium]
MSSASSVPASPPRPSGATPVLSAVPDMAPEPSTRLLLLLLLGAALLPRLVLMPFNENYYGDAVARTELAERWAREPHVITSYGDGAYQFGPLHLYVVGAALKVVEDKALAGRLVSLLFGVLSVVPLFALTRRLFGWRAGVWASLAFSVWGMHLQMSTTAASEALSLFFMLWVFALIAEGLDENRLGPLFGAGVVLNLACAVRYDAWMFIPLLSVALLFWGEDRVAALTRAVGFGLLCLPFPLLWMQGNEMAHGDPFFPITAVEQFHADWTREGVARVGQLRYRLESLGFWPGVALLTLSPGVALLGMVGMWRSWRERPDTRWLVLAALVPTAYFTFRAAVLLNFQPLGRFTVTEVAVLLPFLVPGLEAWRGAGARKAVAGVSAVLAVAVPLALGLYTFRADGRWQDSLRPVSPTSTNPVPLMQVARFLKEEVAAKGGAAVVDQDPSYMDLQLAFFSGLPDERLARVRWETFRKHLREAQPEYLVRFDQGTLVSDPGVKLEGRTLTLDGVAYEEQDGFSAPLHVYRRR